MAAHEDAFYAVCALPVFTAIDGQAKAEFISYAMAEMDSDWWDNLQFAPTVEALLQSIKSNPERPIL